MSEPSAKHISLAEYLTAKPTMDEIAQHLALETCADFRPRTILISLFDSSGTVRTAGVFGVPPPAQSDLALASLWDDAPASEAILNGSPLVFGSVEEFVARYPNLRDQADLFAPAVIWPIQSGQQRFGAIHMQCDAMPDGKISDGELHGLGTVLALYLKVTDYRPDGGSAHTELTARQREVLNHMEQGATNAQIAKRLGFSESTIKQETMAIYRHFGVNSRSEVVRIIQGR